MTLSIVVYFHATSALSPRHLCQSLLAQQEVETEVQIFHAPELELPADLPASWQIKPVAEAASLAEVWREGWAAAQGETVAFFHTPVVLHPLHLACCLKALNDHQAVAVAARADFVDPQLLPVPEMVLPALAPTEWPGFCLASRTLWPIETMVFQRQALDEALFDKLSPQPAAQDWLDWLHQHQVPVLPFATLEVPGTAYWRHSTQTPEHQARLQQLLKTYDAATLTPTAALPADTSHHQALCVQFVCQALRNQGAAQILDAYQQKQTQSLRSVMWLVHEDFSAWMPLLTELQAQGFFPLVLQVTTQRSVTGEPYAMQYGQQQGVAWISISGIPWREQVADELETRPHLVPFVVELLRVYRPERLHLTTLRMYSLFLLETLVRSNIPVYYSLSDDSLLSLYQTLRNPEHLASKNPEYLERLQAQHLLASEFLDYGAAGLVVHDAQQALQLKTLDLPASRIHQVTNAQELAHLYRQPAQVLQKPQAGSSLPMLYQLATGKNFELNLFQDFKGMSTEMRTLVCGRDIDGVLRYLVEQEVWTQATVFSERTTRLLREQGMPVSTGSLENLSFHIHYFDRVYTPYLLEGLNYTEVRKLLSGVVLALKKYGHWILRLRHPVSASAGHDQFWLGEYHHRPYSPALIQRLLEQAGFQVEVELLDAGGPWQDVKLDARLMTESLPLLNLPIATEAFEACWQENPLNIEIQEQDQVLLLGTHIRKTWMIQRVQCEQMLGITLNLAELGNSQQRKLKSHQFRHSRDLIKTLHQNTHRYDLILLEGVVETQTPEQLNELLSLCREHLKPEGRLQIRTLQVEAEAPDPLFWQSLLQVRPYADLNDTLQALGFAVQTCDQQGPLHVYICQQAEPVQSAAVMPKLPALVRSVMKAAAKVYQPAVYTDLLKLTVQSQPCLLLHGILEQIPPEQLQRILQQLVSALELDGSLVLVFDASQDWHWKNSQVRRPYPEQLVDKLLQDLGLQKRSLTRHDHYWVWCGFKRLNCRPRPRPDTLSLRWDGDVLNYHSLSVVNRELLKELLSQTDFALDIHNYSDPAYLPEAHEPDYPLLQKMYRPLPGQPDFVIRHHWPPDFKLPDTAGHWVMIQPWEFGSVPERWIYNLNKFVDQVWVPSEFVRQSYLKSGLLPEKVAVVPNGVDTDVFHPEVPEWVLPTQKHFKFLFVGGGIHRKGIDLLLKGYFQTFTQQDDVCLVIKEFGSGSVYQGFDVAGLIQEQQELFPEGPEVLHLTDSLTVAEMASLYRACDCLVHPYRGEGFALPVAEAMACERPVLVTDYGACLDYCNEDNAYLIPAEEVFFDKKQIDKLATVDFPFWAEPDLEALKALLRHIHANPEEAQQKARRARETIQEDWSWRHSLVKMEAQLQVLKSRPVFRFYRTHLLSETLALGFAGIESQDYQAAVTHFEKALQIDPYQYSVFYNLGVALLMLERYQEALNALTSSLRGGEATADLCYAMATVLRHLGDHPTSQEFFAKARELDPELFNVHEPVEYAP